VVVLICRPPGVQILAARGRFEVVLVQHYNTVFYMTMIDHSGLHAQHIHWTIRVVNNAIQSQVHEDSRANLRPLSLFAPRRDSHKFGTHEELCYASSSVPRNASGSFPCLPASPIRRSLCPIRLCLLTTGKACQPRGLVRTSRRHLPRIARRVVATLRTPVSPISSRW